MLKVLLVDDEMLVRLGIKSCINFNKLGLKLIGEASNGQEALEIVEKELPDIILLDIRMPVMDGLEFMNIIKQKGIYTNIVILSCYNDFEYVKKALKLGAKDYILKLSIKPDELNELLINITQSIYKSDSDLKNHDELDQLNNINYMRNLIFDQDFTGCIPVSLEQQLKNLRYIILKIVYKTDYIESVDKALINIIKEITKEYGVSLIIKENSSLVLFLGFDAKYETTDILEMSQRIFNTVKNCLNIELKISLSDIFSNIIYSHQAYIDACTAYEGLFFSNSSTIIQYNESHNILSSESVIMKEMEQDIYDCLEICDIEKLILIINTFFDEIAASKNVKKQVIISSSLSIVNILSKFKRDNNLPADDMLINSYDYIRSIDNIFELKNWFINIFVKKYVGLIMEKQITLKRKDLKKAVEYINSNYNKKISLSDISKQINMSENYFSYLFKKEYNDTFINYQNKVKVYKAKELLLNEDYRINELSEKLGYTDASYFCKVFKKIIGTSPEQFKKSLLTNKSASQTHV